jgi:hypothetical protein
MLVMFCENLINFIFFDRENLINFNILKKSYNIFFGKQKSIIYYLITFNPIIIKKM